MDNNTTQRNPATLDRVSSQTKQPQKKKASWLRTILWMLSMILLLNVVSTIIVYALEGLAKLIKASGINGQISLKMKIT